MNTNSCRRSPHGSNIVSVNWDDFASIQTIEPIPRATFLPIESLTAESKKLSEELLLAALDSEALYTIVGQIKPVLRDSGELTFRLSLRT